MNEQSILRMIETVDPDDTATLDEINARVWLYVKFGEHDFGVKYGGREGKGRFYYKDDLFTHRHRICKGMNYTRSIDAQESMGPEGWYPCHLRCSPTTKGASFALYHWSSNTKTLAPILPTEALARLHARIQAIAYERSQKDGG